MPPLANHLGRIPAHNDVVWNIAGDDRTGARNYIPTDSDSRTHHGTYPEQRHLAYGTAAAHGHSGSKVAGVVDDVMMRHHGTVIDDAAVSKTDFRVDERARLYQVSRAHLHSRRH